MLRLRRKRLGLTQKQISEILGIDNSYISRIENKNRLNINDDLFKKICDLYLITENDFNTFLNN